MIKKKMKFLENNIGFKKQIGWNFRKYKSQSKRHAIQGSMKKVPPINLGRTANVRTYSKEIVSKASFNALFVFSAYLNLVNIRKCACTTRHFYSSSA